MSDILTNRIKCGSCGKLLLQIRFSESGRKKYEESLNKNKRNPKNPIKYPLCTGCSPGNRQELTCVMCGSTQGLEAFSKAQRRKPDDAHCLDCQQEKEDREPVHQDEVKELSIIAELRNTSLSGNNSTTTLTSRSQKSSEKQDSRVETDTNPGSDYLSDSTQAYLPAKTMKHSTMSSVSDSRAGLVSSLGRNDYSPAFVKQGAVKKNPRAKAAETLERQDRQEREAQEQFLEPYGDDGDDDECDPY